MREGKGKRRRDGRGREKGEIGKGEGRGEGGRTWGRWDGREGMRGMRREGEERSDTGEGEGAGAPVIGLAQNLRNRSLRVRVHASTLHGAHS